MLERIKFIKVNQHKQYQYIPRYYDERKERITALKARYSEKTTDEVDAITHREQLRQRIAENWDSQSSSAGSTSANLRLIFILILLLAGAYFVLDYMELFTGEVTIID